MAFKKKIKLTKDSQIKLLKSMIEALTKELELTKSLVNYSSQELNKSKDYINLIERQNKYEIGRNKDLYNQNKVLQFRIESLQHGIEILAREHSKQENISREYARDENTMMAMPTREYIGEALGRKEEQINSPIRPDKEAQLAKGYGMGEKKIAEMRRRKKRK